jgi:hypothetical protein
VAKNNPTANSTEPRPVELLCDRCGFAYRLGQIWIIDGLKIYFCRECVEKLNAEIDHLSNYEHQRTLENLARRLKLVPRGDRDARYRSLMAAALLGFDEGAGHPDDLFPADAGVREGNHLN